MNDASPSGVSAAFRLTRREHEALELLAQGLTNREIATQLNVALRTAETHIDRVLGKLGASTRTRAVIEARRLGLLGVGLSSRGPASVIVGPWPSSGAVTLPFERATFVGRETEIATLDSMLARGGVAVVFGLGGVGKSALAREYAARNQVRYSTICWLDAQTEDGIIEGLLRLGVVTAKGNDRLADRRIAAKRILDSVLTSSDRPPLFIFDNLQEERHLREWLPGREASALITSQNTAWGEDIHAIPLSVWPIDTAVGYLQREARRSDLTGEDANAIVEALGALPLAISHAAASLRWSRMLAPRRYLEHISAHLNRAPRDVEYPRSVFATFRLAIAQAEHEVPGAAALLCFAASFAPDAIPDELFRQPAEVYATGQQRLVPEGGELDLHSVVADAVQLDEALGALDRLSLLVYSEGSQTYRIHRLVQLASQDLIAANARAWSECAVAVVDAAFPGDGLFGVGFSAWQQCMRLLPHALAALDALPNDPSFLSAGHLAHRCAVYLCQRGEYGAGEALNNRALVIRERSLGTEHAGLVYSLNLFGIIYRQQGRYREAEGAHTRALEIREKAFGPDGVDVSHSLNNLATIYSDQGRYDDASALHERALAIRERSLGPDHADVAESLQNLASSYVHRRRYDDAMALLTRALGIRESVLSPDDPLLAITLETIAEVRRAQGRLREAEPLFIEALKKYENALGPDHPDVAEFLCNFAELYEAQGYSEDARRMYLRALVIREKTLGSDSLRTEAVREKLKRL